VRAVDGLGFLYFYVYVCMQGILWMVYGLYLSTFVCMQVWDTQCDIDLYFRIFLCMPAWDTGYVVLTFIFVFFLGYASLGYRVPICIFVFFLYVDMVFWVWRVDFYFCVFVVFASTAAYWLEYVFLRNSNDGV
jgi:hypothetical protein